MIDHDMRTRKLLGALDEAIDAYDCGIDKGGALRAVLEEIAEATGLINPPFAARVRRVAERAEEAIEPSRRDIASTLARDVRRDLMCTAARDSASRNLCVPDAINAGATRDELTARRRFDSLRQPR